MGMSKLLLAVTLAIAAVAGHATAAADSSMTPQIQSGQIVAPLAATTIYVRNLSASLTLYRDELKMRVLSDEPSSIYGPGRTITLGVSPKKVGQLILVDLGAAGGSAPAPDRVAYGHSGDFAIVIPTNDIWNIYRTLKSKYVFMSAPVTLMQNPNMKVQGVEMSFRDPDGTYVNLVQAGVRK